MSQDKKKAFLYISIPAVSYKNGIAYKTNQAQNIFTLTLTYITKISFILKRSAEMYTSVRKHKLSENYLSSLQLECRGNTMNLVYMILAIVCIIIMR